MTWLILYRLPQKLWHLLGFSHTNIFRVYREFVKKKKSREQQFSIWKCLDDVRNQRRMVRHFNYFTLHSMISNQGMSQSRVSEEGKPLVSAVHYNCCCTTLVISLKEPVSVENVHFKESLILRSAGKTSTNCLICDELYPTLKSCGFAVIKK